MSNYIDKELLYDEMKLSLEKGEPTEHVLEIMHNINETTGRKLDHSDKECFEFCKKSGLDEMKNYWDQFNPDHPAKPGSAYNFLNTMSKNGWKKGWNKFYKIGWFGDPKRDEWIKRNEIKNKK